MPDAVTGKPKRLHVERRINEAEAAVIREIFEKAAAGWGTRRIAHDLNARRRAGSSAPTGGAPARVGALDDLRHADSVPLPRRGRLEPEPQAQRLGHQASDRAGRGASGSSSRFPPCGSSRSRCGRRSASDFATRGRRTSGRRTASSGAGPRTGSSRATC